MDARTDASGIGGLGKVNCAGMEESFGEVVVEPAIVNDLNSYTCQPIATAVLLRHEWEQRS